MKILYISNLIMQCIHVCQQTIPFRITTKISLSTSIGLHFIEFALLLNIWEVNRNLTIDPCFNVQRVIGVDNERPGCLKEFKRLIALCVCYNLLEFSLNMYLELTIENNYGQNEDCKTYKSSYLQHM